MTDRCCFWCYHSFVVGQAVYSYRSETFCSLRCLEWEQHYRREMRRKGYAPLKGEPIR